MRFRFKKFPKNPKLNRITKQTILSTNDLNFTYIHPIIGTTLFMEHTFKVLF